VVGLDAADLDVRFLSARLPSRHAASSKQAKSGAFARRDRSKNRRPKAKTAQFQRSPIIGPPEKQAFLATGDVDGARQNPLRLRAT
jgi:hypothetical protein